MSNSFRVTAVDNEMYLIACKNDGTISYELCHIQSGYNFDVLVMFNIMTGDYSRPETLDGLSGALYKQYNVFIPEGTYDIIAVGISWGGGKNAELTINSLDYGIGGYQAGPFPTNVFWTNEGQPLTTIQVEED